MSKEVFNKVPAARPNYSKFDLSHNRKLSCNLGELVPVLCEEVIPGDVWKIKSSVFARLAPLVSPIMHKVDIFLHGFYVPQRVIWAAAFNDVTYSKSFEYFITGQGETPQNTLVPYAKLEAVTAGSLGDHLGLPVGDWTGANMDINIMPFIAYYMIYDEYYRDENIIDITRYDDAQFQADIIDSPLLKRAWEKDYFTSVWPWAQKGVASAAVIDIDVDTASQAFLLGGTLPTADNLTLKLDKDDGKIFVTDTTDKDVYIKSTLSLDIQELRRANKMQLWMERNARAGTRYTEFLKAHFGVWPKDETLQRPVYIGGMRVPFVISDITNTSGFTASEDPASVEAVPLPMGQMAGKGISYGESGVMYHKADEFGYIIVIMSIRPEAVYFQGMPRKFFRMTYLDYPFPEFADMGEQEVTKKELFMTNDDAVNDTFFGYQSRYAEFKFIPNSVHGTFKTSLEHWHMARKFASAPSLNEDFILIDETNDDLTRVFAVTEGEHVYVQVQHAIECDRPLPFFNIPSLE